MALALAVILLTGAGPVRGEAVSVAPAGVEGAGKSMRAEELEIPERIPGDWPHRAASRGLRVAGLDWHVQVMGAGPTVVLLHGTGASTHSWAELMPALAEVATVVVPDLPGHGFTRGARMEELSLPRVAADLEALMQALQTCCGVGPPVLVAGHSAGAPLAVRWALDGATPPRAIVGFNPSLVPPPASYDWVSAWLHPLATSAPVASLLARLGGPTGLVDRLLDSTGSRLPPAQRARYARLFSDPAHVRGAMGFMAAADLPALLQAGPALRVPVHFVLGRQDSWVPETALQRVIAQSFPQARVQSWEGGHLLHEVEPQRAVTLLRAELERH